MTTSRRRTRVRTKEVVKLGPRAMGELLKPARLEVYECLQVAGPLSVAELAARLGRPADALYYHLRKLRSLGVVSEHVDDGAGDGASSRGAGGTGGRRGRKGLRYAVVARRLDVRLDPSSRVSRRAWSEGGASVLRVGLRDYTGALESAAVRPAGPRRNLLLHRVKLRLDAAQLAEVNEHLDALHELLTAHAENTAGELHAITCLMTPLEEPRAP